MKLLEYEAKGLLAAYGAPVPAGQLVTDIRETPRLPYPVVMKVQIPTGGRGKAGGVKLIYTPSEFRDTAEEFLSRPILGHQARAVLSEEALDIKRELYLAITIDRASRSHMLLAHKQGGIDIEAATQEAEMLKIPLSTAPGHEVPQALLEYFNLSEHFRVPLTKIVMSLWRTYSREDAVLVEVNPLIVTQDDLLFCADAKIELDDAAAFRHDWNFEQKPTGAQFVILHEEGVIGSMANGAGLAMATVDAIQDAGALPANFLDIGGGTNTAGMVAAFKGLSTLPNLRAIVINIFGGITRCDEVAQAIVEARASVPDLPPLFIRLSGTNESEGKAILAQVGISTLIDLKACVKDAVLEAA